MLRNYFLPTVDHAKRLKLLPPCSPASLYFAARGPARTVLRPLCLSRQIFALCACAFGIKTCAASWVPSTMPANAATHAARQEYDSLLRVTSLRLDFRFSRGQMKREWGRQVDSPSGAANEGLCSTAVALSSSQAYSRPLSLPLSANFVQLRVILVHLRLC